VRGRSRVSGLGPRSESIPNRGLDCDPVEADDELRDTFTRWYPGMISPRQAEAEQRQAA
jgi:hypothetical protein